MKTRHRKTLLTIVRIIFVLSLALLVLADLGARAGGAGGGHSSSSGRSSGGGGGGGGDGDLFYIVIILVNAIGPVPTALLVGGFILLAYIYSRKKNRDRKNVYHNLNKVLDQPKKIRGFDKFKERNPDFEPAQFLAKVEIAFKHIQESWSKKDLSKVRPYISDGVYQRFNTQFLMMNELEQTNILSNVRIINTWIDKIERDGSYDIINVGIHAEMKDVFSCKTMPSFNQSGNEDFVEYWTFLRKTGKEKSGEWGDLYQDSNCPNCGSPLPADLGERSQCPHCSTLVNSGEYDWVLSEITQADDYVAYGVIDKNSNLKNRVQLVQVADPNFSIQLAEDKASNAYLQILSSQVSGQPERMRRFVSDEAFEHLKVEKDKATIIFNRLFLNRVVLSSISVTEDSFILAIAITQSSQRVDKSNAKFRLLDPVIRQDDFVLLMERKKEVGTAVKGSLYQHQCHNCGAPLLDSLSTNCNYCDAVLNSGEAEWVVKDLLTRYEYSEWLTEQGSEVKAKISSNLFEKLYDDKDLAMNNLMVLIATDGVFADEERAYAESAAKKWGYKIDNIEALFDLARSGRLRLQIPEDSKRKEKMLALLTEAAMIDGSIGSEEQEILDYIKSA